MIVTPKSRIVLVRQEIKANLGIHKLYGLVKQILNPKCDEDLYVVFINKAHNRLLVLHVDPAGVDLTTRYLFKGLFAQSPYLNDITDSLCVKLLATNFFSFFLKGGPGENSFFLCA